MNMAGLWKLPVVYIVENNLYAMTVSLEKSVAVKHLAERAAGYGFEGKAIDGNDAELVYEETAKAAAEARSGGGPTLLECLTYRWDGHFGGDPGTGYRKREEIEEWKRRDPIRRLKEKLVSANELTEAQFEEMRRGVYAELDEVTKRAVAAPLPAAEVEIEGLFARE
jgi:TPP-dependent pyruvate/acetoin dehydrogenase alpha subunit